MLQPLQMNSNPRHDNTGEVGIVYKAAGEDTATLQFTGVWIQGAAVAKPVLGRLEALFIRFLRPTLNKRRQVHGRFVAVRLHEFEEQD